MRSTLLLLESLALTATAFPWAAKLANSDISALQSPSLVKRADVCPVNRPRKGAAPYNEYYPSKYTGARNGQPGTGKGGVQVPAPGDTAHAYEAPSSTDIRGPCPGLNMAANHHFISHDGQTTYNEMVDFAQNVFNWRYDLAAFVATFGIVQDGNVLTGELSIGCNGGQQVPNTGLNTHDKFEADSSITRTDYYLSPNGDNYSVNETLFNYWNDFCNGDFTLECMGPYMRSRYDQSLHTNGNFFNGPLFLFALGTAALPSQSFASYGNEGTPSVSTIAPFWAATRTSTGHYTVAPGTERLPSYWYNRPTSLSFPEIVGQVSDLYQAAGSPAFGGNTGKPDSFVGLEFPQGGIEGGVLKNSTPQGVACLFYQLVTDFIPLSLDNQVLQLSKVSQIFAKSKLTSVFANFGCPAL
ncbi:unnamed protein product [Zymoseptoria tritici ST99CH_3D1]|nr:unnamed protein product [Zymoseptoria tritici ST99CH_3D1]